MKSREELIEEFEEWTKKYIEADEHLKSLLPHISDLSRGERLQPLVITDKWLADTINHLQVEASLAALVSKSEV